MPPGADIRPACARFFCSSRLSYPLPHHLSSSRTFAAPSIGLAASGADLYNVFASLGGRERDSSSQVRAFRTAVDQSVPTPLVTLAVTATGLTKPLAQQALGSFGGPSPALANFAALLSSSASSLSLTDVYAAADATAPAVAAVRATRGANLHFTAAADTPCADLVAAVASFAGATAPGLLGVNAPTPAALATVDACLPAILPALAEASAGRFVVAIVGSPRSAPVLRTSFGPAAAAEAPETAFIQFDSTITDAAAPRADTVKVGATVYNGPEYVTSDVVTVLVVSFLMLGILWFGFSFTLAIETPVRYATPAMVLPPTREY
jgi:hypothetical protein